MRGLSLFDLIRSYALLIFLQRVYVLLSKVKIKIDLVDPEDACVAAVQRTFVERMNALGHLSPDRSPLVLSLGSLLTLVHHLSGFGRVGVPKCSVWDSRPHVHGPCPGWDHCKALPSPPQLLGRPPLGTAGCWAVRVLEPVSTCACPGSCPTRSGPLPSCSRRLPSPLIPSDIWPSFQPRPALLCLGTVNAGAKDNCPWQLGPRGAARTICTVTHTAAGVGKGPRICLGKGPEQPCSQPSWGQAPLKCWWLLRAPTRVLLCLDVSGSFSPGEQTVNCELMDTHFLILCCYPTNFS